MNISNLSIGERLRTLRKSKHLTQHQLADNAGVCSKSISSFELNKALPSLIKALLIARALEVSVEELCGLEKHFNFKGYAD